MENERVYISILLESEYCRRPHTRGSMLLEWHEDIHVEGLKWSSQTAIQTLAFNPPKSAGSKTLTRTDRQIEE